MSTCSSLQNVGEIQGTYGPLLVLESRVQQMWALQHLHRGNWLTRGGSCLRVVFPGTWNHAAGPDFLEAVLEFEGKRLCGDVEIHLNREDWWRHGHDADPRYDGVILHIVLFAGGMDRPVLTRSGKAPAEWIMGPWIREDLESVCGGPPGLFGELVPELREWLETESPIDARLRLKIGADRRWQDKVSMATCLHNAHGWAGALHRMTLFYLGYPLNRKAFYRVAEAYPMATWASINPLQKIRAEFEGVIRWKSGRPANWAQRRLQQYRQMNQQAAGWTDALRTPPLPAAAGALPGLEHVRDADTRSLRRLVDYHGLRKWLLTTVFRDCLSPSLGNRLWIDVFLPILVADGVLDPALGSMLWFHGHPAACPRSYREFLQVAGVGLGTGRTLSNGWIQGMLWMEDQFRLERVRSSLGAGPTPARGSGA